MDKLSSHLRSLNDIRVRLAHHTMWDQGHDEENPGLKPARFDLRIKSLKYTPPEFDQIVDFIMREMEIMKALNKLARRMRLRASLDEFPQQASNPPTEGAQ